MFPFTEYEGRIDSFYKLMVENKKLADIRIADDKWTLKEMVGHLIDSASNNHQRFIRLQLDKSIDFPAYNAEEWKNVTKLGAFNFSMLMDLWKSYNLFLLHVIKNIQEDSLQNSWNIDGEEFTLQFIADDYFGRHMEWHIGLYKTRIAEINNFLVK